MSWKITFYSDKVEKETLGFPIGILANTIHIMEMIEEFGPNLGMPQTKSMGDGLFEIRAKGKEGIGRSFFAVVIENEVVILNSFIKKSQKTPKKGKPQINPHKVFTKTLLISSKKVANLAIISL